MEHSESFKKAEATIKALEGKLAACGSFNKECEESAKVAEKEIEEYFAKIFNLLAARKATLLGAVQQQLNHQKRNGEEIQNKLESSIDTFKQTMKAAGMFYVINPSSAESMYQNIANAPIPITFTPRITIDLPISIFEIIQALGKAAIPDRFSVAEVVSTLAGSTQGNTDGNGLNAKFNYPWSICTLGNCLYVCDHGSTTIRKVNLQGDVSTFVANNSLQGITSIAGCYNEQAFLVTSDTSHSIYKITSGSIRLVAGSGQNEQHGYHDGAGANAKFYYPRGIAVDQQTGTIYVSDYGNCVIRTITPQGIVSTLAGLKEGFADGTGSVAMFSNPWGLCFDEKTKSLLVCDYHNNKLRQVQLNGDVTTLCEVPQPIGVGLAANGTIFVTTNRKIFKVVCIDQQYKAVKLAGTGQPGRIDGRPSESAFYNSYGIVVHETSHSCYIADAGSHAIRKISFATSV